MFHSENQGRDKVFSRRFFFCENFFGGNNYAKDKITSNQFFRRNRQQKGENSLRTTLSYVRNHRKDQATSKPSSFVKNAEGIKIELLHDYFFGVGKSEGINNSFSGPHPTG